MFPVKQAVLTATIENKPYAWRYRDYVIRSLNEDTPYDLFVMEQLAGDELDQLTRDSIIATEFYCLGVWDDDPPDRRLELRRHRYDVVELATVNAPVETSHWHHVRFAAEGPRLRA